MSSTFRKILVCLVAVFALSAVVASAAFAQDLEQKFVLTKPGVMLGIKGESGAATLKAGTSTVTCMNSSNGGEIEGTTKVKGVVVTFTKCTSAESSKKCSGVAINSTNEPKGSGTIKTTSLKGELGEGVAQAEVAGATVLLLEPPENSEKIKEFVTLEANGCTVTTQVTGTIAGVVEKTGKKLKVGEKAPVVFKEAAGKEQVTELERSVGNAIVKPSLKAFGVTATQTVTSETSFEQELEINPGN